MTPSDRRGLKRGVGKNSAQLFFPGASYSQFLSQNWLPWQQGSSKKNFKWQLQIALVWK